jgi:NTP pyrophosphatase (non-canonical NTP hydrolase)
MNHVNNLFDVEEKLEEKLEEKRDKKSPVMRKIQSQDFIDMFKQQQQVNYDINAAHGFEDMSIAARGTEYEMDNLGLKIALIHSELSEALESFRKGDPASDHIPEFTGSEEEFADVIIRIMNIAAGRGLRVAEAMIAKQEFNSARPYKHGGKKF